MTSWISNIQNLTITSPVGAPEVVRHDVKHVWYGFFLNRRNFTLVLTDMMKRIKNKHYCNASDRLFDHGELKETVLKWLQQGPTTGNTNIAAQFERLYWYFRLSVVVANIWKHFLWTRHGRKSRVCCLKNRFTVFFLIKRGAGAFLAPNAIRVRKIEAQYDG